MLRLPSFRYLEPRTLKEALRWKSESGPESMYVAGGTDLYPNMKRRHQEPKVVISLARIRALRPKGRSRKAASGLTLAPMMTLTELVESEGIRESYPVLARAAELISTPILRNMGTLGGNLCLDTRCNYYNQSYEWRKAINFCLKKDGAICWVAPSSPRCWAVNSSDLAPVMVAIGADFLLVGPEGERTVAAADFYQNDGIDYLSKHPGEILAEIRVPPRDGWEATYWKLRRRGSFDFPVLGVAAWVRWEEQKVAEARIVLGAVASQPQPVPEAAAAIIGSRLDDEAIEEAALAAFRPSKPMDNTDFGLAWRKEMTRQFVRGALKELRSKLVE
ncbi:4-hydroxybenzoyl-CoA reductase subunit beta [bacterium HR33]|nr:4-hydroxybenzoyl-CoA reductase subunit beta [bacterium HR33]